MQSGVLDDGLFQIMMATRALSRLIGKENQLGMKKIPMKLDIKFDLLHIIPIIRRTMCFPKANFLVYGFELKWLCHNSTLSI
jgi:hypothetical protein